MDDTTTRHCYDEQSKRYSIVGARPMQIYTHRLKREAMAPLVARAQDVLYLCCGKGRLTRWIADEKRRRAKFLTIHGADFGPEMVAVAEALNGDRPASYGVGDAMALPYPDEESSLFARYAYYAPYYLMRRGQRLLQRRSSRHRVLNSRENLASLPSGRFEELGITGLRVVPDFVPKFPMNIWPPLSPGMRAFVRASERLDRRLAVRPKAGCHASFHLATAKVRK